MENIKIAISIVYIMKYVSGKLRTNLFLINVESR